LKTNIGGWIRQASWFEEDDEDGVMAGVSTDPDRNKGKTDWTGQRLSEELKKEVGHVICPSCSAEVYPSGFTVKTQCGMCWNQLPKELQQEPDERVKNAVQTTSYSGNFTGSYNKSLTNFATQRRSMVEKTSDASMHLMSRVNIHSIDSELLAERAAAKKLESANYRKNNQHCTLQHIIKTTDVDDYVSSTSENYTNKIAQEIELFTRALQKYVVIDEAKNKFRIRAGEEREWGSAEKAKEVKLAEKQVQLRALASELMSEIGTAIGHKIGDQWYLRDTTEEALQKQRRAKSSAQPAYYSALSGKNLNPAQLDMQYPERNPVSGNPWLDSKLYTPKIWGGIAKNNIAKPLDEVTTNIAKAKEEDRLNVMVDELFPLVVKILTEEDSAPTNRGEKANQGKKRGGGASSELANKQEDVRSSIEEAMKGKGSSNKPAAHAMNQDGYEKNLQEYMNDVGKDIVDHRRAEAKQKAEQKKWSRTAKRIDKAYKKAGASRWGGRKPLFEGRSVANFPVKQSFYAEQMLESMKDERRVKWSDKGDVTDRVMEMNYGNLKVFREEDLWRPRLVVGVDVSGSTGCICKAGVKNTYQDAGALIWEVASALTMAGNTENTKVYAYHDGNGATLSVTEVNAGTRPLCTCEHRYGDKFGDVGIEPTHEETGGGTPEYAMLHYLHDKAQEFGSLAETTIIQIVDGQPDLPQKCAEYADELVTAGVQFGIVLVGKYAESYHKDAYTVKVKASPDIPKALEKMFSLIRERGFAG
tara:strand:+ start:5071 stop:7341 length:2271 start_codon:yes stop_codon:yes gene_type:complete